MNQMHENLSLFSFWGLIFALTAVTVFVVVYAYKNRTAIGGKYEFWDLEKLPAHAVCDSI